MSAQFLAITTICTVGDNIVSTPSLYGGQGLTLVHISAQLEPILTQKPTLDTP
jgi:O-acetylhomoserine/O-acetylserine sulfhydrylase-like pyridoxal-dependent enzyme